MRKNIWNKSQIKLLDKTILMGYNFFTGVPDSLLKIFIREIDYRFLSHIPSVHESQAMGIAVGAELAGRKSCVYLQNSGLGNLVNPITSLCHPFKIYPLIIIGHRHSLTQHKLMGKIDISILSILNYNNYIIVLGDNNVK